MTILGRRSMENAERFVYEDKRMVDAWIRNITQIRAAVITLITSLFERDKEIGKYIYKVMRNKAMRKRIEKNRRRDKRCFFHGPPRLLERCCGSGALTGIVREPIALKRDAPRVLGRQNRHRWRWGSTSAAVPSVRCVGGPEDEAKDDVRGVDYEPKWGGVREEGAEEGGSTQGGSPFYRDGNRGGGGQGGGRNRGPPRGEQWK
ncbi:hypothetical protein K438DRAFT_1768545 [Mycena galopus ATCC 62051]|nr:hypothetical protein K438DRAFT_1768545 [Mycena galopus ATCC 62051]